MDYSVERLIIINIGSTTVIVFINVFHNNGSFKLVVARHLQVNKNIGNYTTSIKKHKKFGIFNYSL